MDQKLQRAAVKELISYQPAPYIPLPPSLPHLSYYTGYLHNEHKQLKESSKVQDVSRHVRDRTCSLERDCTETNATVWSLSKTKQSITNTLSFIHSTIQSGLPVAEVIFCFSIHLHSRQTHNSP